MSEGLKIDDWLDGERDALTDDLEAALAPRRTEPEAFGAGVRERIRRAEGAEVAEGGAEPLRLERQPELEPVAAGGLSWAAGLLPPMLLSKGASKAVLGVGTAAASKAGTKLTLKAVPALAAMPVFTLLMIAATLVYAIRGQLGLSGDGAQRTDEREAESAVRAWWGRNLVPTLITRRCWSRSSCWTRAASSSTASSSSSSPRRWPPSPSSAASPRRGSPRASRSAS